MVIVQARPEHVFLPLPEGGTDTGRLPLATIGTIPPVALVPLEFIQVHPNGHGELADLEGLAASIRAHGVLQPLVVTPDGRLLAGRRRLAAAQRAGLATVPVRICEISDERGAIEISLIENVERSDLDPLTRARAYRALLEQGAQVEEIADLVGQRSEHVYQYLALLDLHPQVQAAIQTREIAPADAQAFAKLESSDQAEVLTQLQSASKGKVGSKPLAARQIRLHVDAARVVRRAQATAIHVEPATAPLGNYVALFETDEKGAPTASAGALTPLEDLNALVAEMVAAAQGEDQVRAWARRLSHILEQLQGQAAESSKPRTVQDQLF